MTAQPNKADTSATPDTPDTLIFTDAAATKVNSLIEEEGDRSLSLRVYITGGGCSGFQYGFMFDKDQADDDIVIENTVDAHVINLLVDPMSYQYLRGATVDYRTSVQGEQFVIKNPNAKTTCGCGSSFDV